MNELLFLETDQFTRWVRKNRLGVAVEKLKADLSRTPDTGEVIPGTGGLRKVRMAGAGRGKRGGFRVIYVLVVNRAVAAMIEGYSKSEQEDLTAEQLAGLVARAQAILPFAEQLVRDQTQPEEG